MAYVDTDIIHTPATGAVAPAAWGLQVRDNLEFLVEPPACSVFNSVAQSLANSTLTVLNANSEAFDSDAMHSTVTNNSRITIQTAGRYEFCATVFFASDPDGTRFIEFIVNGTTRYNIMQIASAGASQETILTGSRKLDLAVGDYVEVRARHIAGAALDVTLNEFSTEYSTR